MPDPTVHPELSIIIPVLNEAAGIAALFRTLAGQRDVAFEAILCDGGSTDGTLQLAERLAAEVTFPVRAVVTEAGRGRQMNAGAGLGRSDQLLFLHADSTFDDPMAIRKGLDEFKTAAESWRHNRLAGRFRLRFNRVDAQSSPAWYFYEWKARLDRPGCVHGDQGLLVSREFFAEIGPFDETLPILEDTRIADRIRATGTLLLLPAEIVTSARRFEVEGLRERQTMNAILMNFAAIGWDELLGEIPGLYKSQDRTGKLKLYPLFTGLERLIGSMPPDRRRLLWRETGRYVRGNAWQLAFALDAHRCCRDGIPAGKGEATCLDFYDRHLDRLINNSVGELAAALLTRLWFRLTLVHALLTGQDRKKDTP